jgi:hypothetical protein
LKGSLDKSLARSYWDGAQFAHHNQALQPPLVQYAAIDAYVGGKIAEILKVIGVSLNVYFVPPSLMKIMQFVHSKYSFRITYHEILTSYLCE